MSAHAGELLVQVTAAHGGRGLWDAARGVRVRISASGLPTRREVFPRRRDNRPRARPRLVRIEPWQGAIVG